MVSTVTGWRNELNCEASTMYATPMPRKRAKKRLLMDSRKATLAPPSTTRVPPGSSLASFSTVASASSWFEPGATLA